MDEGIGFFESFFVGLFGDGVLLRFTVGELGVIGWVVIGKRAAGVGRFLRYLVGNGSKDGAEGGAAGKAHSGCYHKPLMRDLWKSL